MATEKIIKARTRYARPSDLKTVLITGAFGGVNTIGTELSVNFYVDRSAEPDYVDFTVDPDTNKILGQKQSPEHTDSIREIVASAVMSKQTVEIIRDWLTKKLVEMESHSK